MNNGIFGEIGAKAKRPGVNLPDLPVVVFIAVIWLLNGSQAIFLPYSDLAYGLGYDGAWYFDPANSFFPRMDNYHLFRIAPSTFVYFSKLFIFKDHDYSSTVRAFQLMNLLWISLSIWVSGRIASYLNFSQMRTWFYLSILFLNFHVLKDSYFNPIMTDSFVFFLSNLLVWFFISGNQKGLFITFILMLFSFPIGGFLLQMFYLFYRVQEREQEFLLPKAIGKYLGICMAALFLILTSVIVYGLGLKTVLTFPDDINPWLFPISLITVSGLLFFIIERHSNLFQLLFLIKKLRIDLQRISIIFFILTIAIYIFVPFLNHNPAKGFTGNFSIGPPIYLTLKPFIGYFDNIMYLGPIILLFLLFQYRFIKFYKLNLSYLFFSFFLNLFLLKPEARHTLFLLPILALLVARFVDVELIRKGELIFFVLLCLLFSKFWYPTYLATFPPAREIFTSKVNHAIFQEFPIQHYFMFIGPLISHVNYFIWSGIILILSIYTWMLGRRLFGTSISN